MPARAPTHSAYSARMHERAEAVRRNASKRVRGLPVEPLPDKLLPPLWPVAYQADGTYEGVLQAADECPAGCVIHWEAATRDSV